MPRTRLQPLWALVLSPVPSAEGPRGALATQSLGTGHVDLCPGCGLGSGPSQLRAAASGGNVVKMMAAQEVPLAATHRRGTPGNLRGSRPVRVGSAALLTSGPTPASTPPFHMGPWARGLSSGTGSPGGHPAVTELQKSPHKTPWVPHHGSHWGSATGSQIMVDGLCPARSSTEPMAPASQTVQGHSCLVQDPRHPMVSEMDTCLPLSLPHELWDPRFLSSPAPPCPHAPVPLHFSSQTNCISINTPPPTPTGPPPLSSR